MNVLLKQREVSFYLSDSGATQLFVWHGFADEAEQGAKQAGTDVIVVAARASSRSYSPALRANFATPSATTQTPP